MFAGPIIAREVLTAPRPARYYLWRASFVCFLFILLWTAWQSFIGWEVVRELGVMARFGGILYWLFAMLQLTLMLFFAPLFTAAAVSYEKDRRTFTLLLMTDLSDLEIVVGKLVAGLLNIFTILGASVGFLSICAFFGGISFGQVANLFLVTAASGVAGGALGLLIALWRDRTFQSIALTILMVVFSVAGVEAFAIAFPTLEFLGVPLVEVLNPYRAMVAVLYPQTDQMTGVVRASSIVYIGARLTFAAALVAFGTWKLRKWNPGKNEPRELREEGEVEAVETLIEVAEEPAEEVALGWDRQARAHRGQSAVAVSDRATAMAIEPATNGQAAGDDLAGPTTGLHVPRRTHRRIVGKARTVSPPLGQSDPLARAHDPGVWHQAADHQGLLCVALSPGDGIVPRTGPRARKPAPVDSWPDTHRSDDLEPRLDQCPGRHRAHQRARYRCA